MDLAGTFEGALAREPSRRPAHLPTLGLGGGTPHAHRPVVQGEGQAVVGHWAAPAAAMPLRSPAKLQRGEERGRYLAKPLEKSPGRRAVKTPQLHAGSRY